MFICPSCSEVFLFFTVCLMFDPQQSHNKWQTNHHVEEPSEWMACESMTTSSNPSNFLTTQSRISPSTWISTFFGVNVLCSLSEAFQYSGFKNIRSLKLLSHWVTMNLAERWWQFGWWMSHFCKQNFVFCPPSQQHFTSLYEILYLNLHI